MDIGSTTGAARGFRMPEGYTAPAVNASETRKNRRLFDFSFMSNKIALSDMKKICSTV